MNRLLHWKPALLLIFLSLSFGGFLGSVPEVHATRFNDQKLFPAWNEEAYEVKALHGRNSESTTGDERDEEYIKGDAKLLVYFIPRVLDILLYLFAPMALIMLLYAGARLVWANGVDEDIQAAKSILYYTAVGSIITLISYTLLKLVYYIISSTS